MDSWLSEPARLVFALALCVLLAAMEAAWPMVRYPGERRRHYGPNLTLTGLFLVSNLFLAALPSAASLWTVTHSAGVVSLLETPTWLTLLLAVAGLDLAAYWAHRLLHLIPIGWRFHTTHHSERFVDVTTAFRQHPFETAWRFAFTTAGVLLLGVPPWALAVYLAASASNALLEHSNLALPPSIDGWLRLVLVTPNMHKLHHSRDRAETNSNYANVLSIWDRLFRSYTPGARGPAAPYGLDGHDTPAAQNLRGLLTGRQGQQT